MTDRQTTRRRVLKHFAIGATSASALTGHAAAHGDDDDATAGDDDDDTTSGTGGSNGATGRVMLTFDHISPSIFDTAAPILREYDYPALLAVVTNRVSSGELAQLQQLQSMGWEIGSHSMGGHPSFTGLSIDQLVQQAQGSKEWLTNNGFAQNGGSIVYPFGAADSRVADVVRQYFSVGFYGGSSTGDPLLIGRVNGDNVSQTKQAIANAANNGGTVAIMYHTVGANDGRVTTAGFRETMEYIAGQDVQVVPASALAGGTSNDGGPTGSDESDGNNGSTDDDGSSGDDSGSTDDDGQPHDSGGNDGDESGGDGGSDGDSGSSDDSDGHSHDHGGSADDGADGDGSDGDSGSSDDGDSGSSDDSDGHSHDHGGSSSNDGGSSSNDGGSTSNDGGSSSSDGHSHDHSGSGSSDDGSSSDGHSH